MEYFLDKYNNIDILILKKKKLIKLFKNLTKLEYIEIFNIIQQNNGQYSENKNGIFVNLSNISEHILDKIFNFLNFIKHNKEDLNKNEEYVNNTQKKIIDINENIDNLENIENSGNLANSENISNNIHDIHDNNSKYLSFSSEEDEDVENKISLKKKKNKYSGTKAKMIKSIKDNDFNKNKK